MTDIPAPKGPQLRAHSKLAQLWGAARLAVFVTLLPAALGAEEPTPPQQPQPDTSEVAVVRTNHGTFVFGFFTEQAPKTAEHFKALVREGFYDGQEYYRVVAGHVIQAGDEEGESGRRVAGEFRDDLYHVPGAVGLARDTDPDSGSTEFYVCLDPRPHLDGKYALFGQVVEGLDVVAKIGAVDVDEQWIGEGKVAFHRPRTPVIIESLTLEKRGSE